jgi:hypothetical protein
VPLASDSRSTPIRLRSRCSAPKRAPVRWNWGLDRSRKRFQTETSAPGHLDPGLWVGNGGVADPEPGRMEPALGPTLDPPFGMARQAVRYQTVWRRQWTSGSRAWAEERCSAGSCEPARRPWPSGRAALDSRPPVAPSPAPDRRGCSPAAPRPSARRSLPAAQPPISCLSTGSLSSGSGRQPPASR